LAIISSAETRETVGPITLFSIAILSATLTVVWGFFIALLPSVAFCTQNVSNLIPTPGVEFMGLPLLMFLVVIVLRRIGPIGERLTTTNIVYLYVASIGVAYFANTTYPWHDAGMTVLTRLYTSESFMSYIPEFVAPSKDVAQRLIAGVGSVSAIPWDSLFPTILWEFLLVALFGGISVGLGSILRREWIEVERLPFPHVMVAYSCLSNIENMGTKKWFTKRVFLTGALVGAVIGIPLSGSTLFPWFPDVFSMRANTCGPGSQWFAPSDIPWHLGMAKHIPLYVLLLLTPLNDLLSVLIFTLIMEIGVFGSFYGFGAYTGMTSIGFCGRNWCSPTPYTNPPLYLASVNSGAMLGLFIATIISQRQYLLNTIRSALARGGGGDREKIEGEEPMSYRASWIMIIASYIMIMIFFIYTGFSPWMSFVLPLSGIITWFVMAQLWGRVGFMVEPCYDFTPALIRLFAWPTGFRPDVISTDAALAPTMSREWIGHQSIAGWGGSFYSTLASYQMARLSGVKPRNVLKVLLVAMFTAMFFTHVTQILVPGLVGWTKLNYGNAAPDLLGHYDGNFWNRPVNEPLTNVATNIALGFVFMVVMRLLYARFLWLPDPLMSIVAWDWVISLHGTWTACLFAYVAKFIILRIGGSKFYEEKVIPFVGGFMLGTTAEVLLAALTSYAMSPRVF